jgi:glucose/mannose-6-phosphate isomerase
MDLNDLKKIKESDTGHLAESLALLPQQIKNIWREAKKIKLSADFLEIDKIVIFGMGGSNLGARIIASVFKKDLKIPLIIEAGYEIPGYVNKRLFVFCLLIP